MGQTLRIEQNLLFPNAAGFALSETTIEIKFSACGLHNKRVKIDSINTNYKENKQMGCAERGTAVKELNNCADSQEAAILFDDKYLSNYN